MSRSASDRGQESSSVENSSLQHRYRTNTHPPSSPSSRSQRIRPKDGKQQIRSSTVQAEIEKEESMIYLEGPQIYTCAQCRTHLTSHDDIISKSFHGRNGRAYLLDECINVTKGPSEDRLLITGMHSVCDIFCKRCKTLVGWTYAKAYEPSQKYKEGKFIIEKIHLHLEETIYGIQHPAGERTDKWRVRSMSWGSNADNDRVEDSNIIYEYQSSINAASTSVDMRSRLRSASVAIGNTVAFAVGSSPSSEKVNDSSPRERSYRLDGLR